MIIFRNSVIILFIVIKKRLVLRELFVVVVIGVLGFIVLVLILFDFVIVFVILVILVLGRIYVFFLLEFLIGLIMELSVI